MSIKVGDWVKLKKSAYNFLNVRDIKEFKNRQPLKVKSIGDCSISNRFNCTVCNKLHNTGKYFIFHNSKDDNTRFTECEVIPLLDKKINKILKI